jgi:hypothetical protein
MFKHKQPNCATTPLRRLYQCLFLLLHQPLTQDFLDDVEANWSGDESRQVHNDAPADETARPGSSVRDLSSTVSTVIWRGVEVVRNTTGFPRRSPEDVDRDR